MMFVWKHNSIRNIYEKDRIHIHQIQTCHFTGIIKLNWEWLCILC